MSGVGLCWRKLKNENQWHKRILGKFRSKCSVFAHNVTKLQTSKALQPGGVGIVATDKVAHRVTEHGQDPSGLDVDEILRKMVFVHDLSVCTDLVILPVLKQ
jgi:hypothetical protein